MIADAKEVADLIKFILENEHYRKHIIALVMQDEGFQIWLKEIIDTEVQKVMDEHETDEHKEG